MTHSNRSHFFDLVCAQHSTALNTVSFDPDHVCPSLSLREEHHLAQLTQRVRAESGFQAGCPCPLYLVHDGPQRRYGWVCK